MNSASQPANATTETQWTSSTSGFNFPKKTPINSTSYDWWDFDAVAPPISSPGVLVQVPEPDPTEPRNSSPRWWLHSTRPATGPPTGYAVSVEVPEGRLELQAEYVYIIADAGVYRRYTGVLRGGLGLEGVAGGCGAL
ncbi:hypothetical protein BJY00DRAFT_309823 [Aspergillus carlsbadensis]|nr:hypothetical protein BJY00DRAFT_309823 [Aspergillus carlsbadensis]